MKKVYQVVVSVFNSNCAFDEFDCYVGPDCQTALDIAFFNLKDICSYYTKHNFVDVRAYVVSDSVDLNDYDSVIDAISYCCCYEIVAEFVLCGGFDSQF